MPSLIFRSRLENGSGARGRDIGLTSSSGIGAGLAGLHPDGVGFGRASLLLGDEVRAFQLSYSAAGAFRGREVALEVTSEPGSWGLSGMPNTIAHTLTFRRLQLSQARFAIANRQHSLEHA